MLIFFAQIIYRILSLRCSAKKSRFEMYEENTRRSQNSVKYGKRGIVSVFFKKCYFTSPSYFSILGGAYEVKFFKILRNNFSFRSAHKSNPPPNKIQLAQQKYIFLPPPPQSQLSCAKSLLRGLWSFNAHLLETF